jgi:ubiquinone/menaquinone biosynthesis C-methylase UbiE
MLASIVRSMPGLRIVPTAEFHSDAYMRINKRRQEHLATLGLDLSAKTVLEVGAGVGDHTDFFLDRGCEVTVTDGRPENVEVLHRHFPNLKIALLDLDNPPAAFEESADVVYCYGTLYHLSRPAQALEFLSRRCGAILLLETCVSFGDLNTVNLVEERAYSPSQAVSGTGCRPTRPWVYSTLKQWFEHVYLPTTQPWHKEFPLDWTTPPADPNALTRAVFIASRSAIVNPLLSEEIPIRQVRC